ncbi:hypothetical protein D3C81_1623360 [compost metagenome]
MRSPTASQMQSDALDQAFDVTAGEGLFDLICPPGNVTEVAIRYSIYNNQPFFNDERDWMRVPLRHFNEQERHPYYYFVAGKIGIYPPPEYDTFYGIKIFYTPIIEELTLEDLNNGSGFDPNFDMLLVYGVLRDIVPGNEAFELRYQQIYTEYRRATNDYEKFVVQESW